MNPMRLDGPARLPFRGGQPDALVLLLHGLGADGEDLIGLAEAWAPSAPGARFESPHAPFPCDMGPYGRQWFSLQDRSPTMMAAGARVARDLLGGWIAERLAALALGHDRLVLMGFSQGAMMALQVGLRLDPAPAAILAFSGLLIDPDALRADLGQRSAASLPPVLLVHGEADQVVPVAASRAAETVLRSLGVRVQALYRPGLGHGIDDAGIAAAAAMLTALG